jgi:hypothetical protein
MKNIIVALVLLVAIAGAAGTYTDWQQGAMQGLKIGFHMGQAYSDAVRGYNVTGFNAEVDTYNAWVRQNFGEDPNLMMNKMSGAATPGNPLWINRSTAKPVHKIDGSFQNQNTYPQPDANGLIHGWPADAYYSWYPDAITRSGIQSGSDVNPGMGQA